MEPEYEKLLKKDLKKLCCERQLDASGVKIDLIVRLKKYDREQGVGAVANEEAHPGNEECDILSNEEVKLYWAKRLGNAYGGSEE